MNPFRFTYRSPGGSVISFLVLSDTQQTAEQKLKSHIKQTRPQYTYAREDWEIMSVGKLDDGVYLLYQN